DEQPTQVAVADLGDRSLSAFLAAGVLRGYETDEGHELGGAAEAVEVADLGDERERGQRVDPTQTAQPGNELCPPSLLGRLPVGPRLIATAHRRPAAQQPLDRLLVVGQPPLLQKLIGAHRRNSNRASVHAQPNRYRRRRVVHGRRPPYVALPGQTPATHDKCV